MPDQPKLYQLEFFGDFFPPGDPRRVWCCNGEPDVSIASAKAHYVRNVDQARLRGYSLCPARIVDPETRAVLVEDDELRKLIDA